MSFTNSPNDPLFANAWHLKNVGGAAQGNGTVGADIRVTSAWQKYTGKGVLVGVLDDGVELTHPDLIANLWTRPGSVLLVDASNANLTSGVAITAGLDGPGDNHGTPVAGVIAAVGNNGIGGVGVAPGAQLVSYRVLGSNNASADLGFRQALNDGAQVLNNSWGADAAFNNPGSATLTAIATLGTQGRGGLGTIIAFAEGNERGSKVDGVDRSGTDGGLDRLTNTRFVIAVAATDNNGVVTDYSTRGSNLLISAPGGGSDGNLIALNGILATDRVGPTNGYNSNPSPAGDYTGFNGTSAATPVLSGVAALILEANAGLGYRDMQEILAYTARQVDVLAGTTGHTSMNRSEWVNTHAGNANGGGLKFSTDYGFGLVDAGAAVRLAETWKAVRTEANLITTETAATATGSITTGGVATVQNFSTSFVVTQPGQTNSGFRINRIELDLSLSAPRPSELTITLTSPDATMITLARTPGNAFGVISSGNYAPTLPTAWPAGGFTMATPGFWGEKGVGSWTLTISANANAVDAAAMTAATLRLFGDSNAGADLRHTEVITDDFARLAGLETARTTIAADRTAINAAPMTQTVTLDYSGAGPSSLGGQAVTFAGTALVDAFGGAGNDLLLGGAAANTLGGGWGNDVLRGNGGNDTLAGGDGDDVVDGGTGQDSLSGGVGNDTYLVDDAGDVAVEAADAGSDTVFVVANGWTVGANIEVARLFAGATQVTGGAGADIIVANAAAVSAVAGGAGDDVLWGGGNLAHTLDGGVGDDIIRGQDSPIRMIGGAGNDQFVIGHLDVTINETATGGIDTAWVAVSGWTIGLNVEIGRLAAPNAVLLNGSDSDEQLVANQAEASTLNGNGGNDVLWGSTLADTLNGGAGDDIMRSQGGADVMAGGAGNDAYVAFDSAATITELADEGFDIVYFAGSGSFNMGANVEQGRLFVSGTGLVGNASANALFGNNAGLGSTLDGAGGDDIIFGTAAVDVLIGGAGNDTMYSQGGADFFDYKAAGWGTDLIGGFTQGEAKMRFEAASGVSAFDQLSLTSANGNTQVNHANGVILVFGATLIQTDFLFV